MRSILLFAVLGLAGCQSCVDDKPAAQQDKKEERPIILREADGGRAFKLNSPPPLRQDLVDGSSGAH